MCGIAAIFNYKSSSPVDRGEMQRMLDRMKRRGPDGVGEWYSPHVPVGLGHRRLAIIDLSEGGAQPMSGPSNNALITFNGEIYNYRELRSELQSLGHQFKSDSDTEVLLHLYQEYGEKMLTRLRGMYAFAIWDQTKRELFLARDPFGIKPLYYSDNGKCFRAASQVKALLAGGQIDTSPAPAGHVGYFIWGHIPDPWTLYKGIKALPAGTFLRVSQSGAGPITTFCSISQILAQAESRSASESGLRPPASGLAAQASLREALLDTVRHHLIADVPVGVFLSAGLDSTTLAALATECGGRIKTVTLGFEEYKGTPQDETILAALVAKHYGTEHQTIWITKQDFQKSFDSVMDAMDQPTHDGINSFFVSRAAAEAGLKVALSGLGGDELFGGYPSFTEIPKAVNRLKYLRPLQPLNKVFTAMSAPVLRHFMSPKYAGLLEYGGSYGGAYFLRRGMFMPWELPKFLDPDLVRAGWRELETIIHLAETTSGVDAIQAKISALELSWYMRNQLLRDTDWGSMAHSVEVRVPFVDNQLLRNIVSTAAEQRPHSKQDMADASKPALPYEILNRAKTGFFVPVHKWLAESKAGRFPVNSLRDWARVIYFQFTAN